MSPISLKSPVIMLVHPRPYHEDKNGIKRAKCMVLQGRYVPEKHNASEILYVSIDGIQQKILLHGGSHLVYVIENRQQYMSSNVNIS